jgi:hypothetical protein
MTSARTAALATLRLAAASWVVAVPQMNGMDMRVATRLGSFAFFVAEGARLAIAGRASRGFAKPAVEFAQRRMRVNAVGTGACFDAFMSTQAYRLSC